MARLLVTQRSPTVFPQLEQTYLLQSFQQAMASGSQCHPRLKSISHGHAIFESCLRVQYTPQCKIGYRLICRVPLTDPLFQTEKNVEYLYYSQASPHVTFIPEGYYDNRGHGIVAPI